LPRDDCAVKRDAVDFGDDPVTAPPVPEPLWVNHPFLGRIERGFYRDFLMAREHLAFEFFLFHSGFRALRRIGLAIGFFAGGAGSTTGVGGNGGMSAFAKRGKRSSRIAS